MTYYIPFNGSIFAKVEIEGDVARIFGQSGYSESELIADAFDFEEVYEKKFLRYFVAKDTDGKIHVEKSEELREHEKIVYGVLLQLSKQIYAWVGSGYIYKFMWKEQIENVLYDPHTMSGVAYCFSKGNYWKILFNERIALGGHGGDKSDDPYQTYYAAPNLGSKSKLAKKKQDKYFQNLDIDVCELVVEDL